VPSTRTTDRIAVAVLAIEALERCRGIGRGSMHVVGVGIRGVISEFVRLVCCSGSDSKSVVLVAFGSANWRRRSLMVIVRVPLPSSSI
jgi:hypothetical protein